MKIIRLLAIFWLLGSAPVLAGQELERRFMWNEANALVASAATAQDFLRAAEAYQAMADRGIQNGPLFYNLGTALLMAGEHGRARYAFLRAERYMGSGDDIKRNILITLRREQQDETLTLPWHRFVFFWHFEMSTSVRAAVATGAFALFWLALILKALGSKQIFRQLLILALIVFVSFGSSAVVSLHHEAQESERKELQAQRGQGAGATERAEESAHEPQPVQDP